MTTPPKARSPGFYRMAVLLAVVGAAYLIASGRVAAYVRFFAEWPPRSAPSEDVLGQLHATALIWLAAIAPLLYASWELGRQHTGARRIGYVLPIGLLAVLRIALRGELVPAQTRAFDRAPEDR